MFFLLRRHGLISVITHNVAVSYGVARGCRFTSGVRLPPDLDLC
jgi:hypothetical protein